MNQTSVKTVKICMAGDPNVGKTQVVLRYADNFFSENYYTTAGVDFRIKSIDKDGQITKLFLWDTAGQERFRVFNESNYKGAHGIMIVYDISDRKSFQNVESWLENIEKFAPKKVEKLLVGNKSDLESNREVLFEEGKRFAEKHGLELIETSAKEAKNVDLAFGKLFDQIQKNFEIIPKTTGSKQSCLPF